MKNILITILGISVLGLGYLLLTKTDKISGFTELECPSPVAVYEDPTRMPLRSFVLDEMGDLTGKSVVDIGAGPGFFTFEMAESADKVIATELDPMFIDYMRDKVEGLSTQNIEVVEAQDDHSEFNDMRYDYALMVFVFHYLEDPKLFLDKVKKGMNPEGEIFIANGQLSSVIIQDYLTQAGFFVKNVSHFSFTQPGGCGDLEVQMIRAVWPADQVQI